MIVKERGDERLVGKDPTRSGSPDGVNARMYPGANGAPG
jgi:hypothetical protein